jgi:hypothetical protein
LLLGRVEMNLVYKSEIHQKNINETHNPLD